MLSIKPKINRIKLPKDRIYIKKREKKSKRKKRTYLHFFFTTHQIVEILIDFLILRIDIYIFFG